MMTRTQIQLSETQARRLKELAAAQGRSMADLVREGVELVLARSGLPGTEERRERALAVVGRFRSGVGDTAERHDEHHAPRTVPGTERGARKPAAHRGVAIESSRPARLYC